MRAATASPQQPAFDHTSASVQRSICIGFSRPLKRVRHCRHIQSLQNSYDALDSAELQSDIENEDPPLPPPPDLQNKAPRKYWNAVALAFLGDSVWELYVRRKFFYPPVKMSEYYKTVIGNVRAEAQEGAYIKLIEGTILTDDERSILRWGLNATGTSPKRFSQGTSNKQTYRAATALECLIGFLYLTDQDRLHSIVDFLDLQPAAAKQRPLNNYTK